MQTLTRARSLGLAIIVITLTACSDSSDHAGRGDESAPVVQWPESEITVGPLVSGTASAIEGTLAWTDYVYDDRGPNTDSGDRTDMASAGGDNVYDGLSNAADFVQVQLRNDSDGLHIRVVLETLLDAAVPLVGIAFDTDRDSATGAAKLPGAWQPDGALGTELLVVLAQGAGEIRRWDNGQWSKSVAPRHLRRDLLQM